MPSVIHAKIKGNTATMSEFQESQETSRYCTDITYTVLSSKPLEIIKLSVASAQQLRSFSTALPTPQEVFVYLLLCPLGFTLTGDPPKCDCTGELDRKRARRAIPNVWRVGMPLMQSGLRAAPEVQQC